jgi:condensin complex subunit 3
MAVNSFGLFVQQLTAADDELKLKIVQVLFDLLMVQDIPTLVSKIMQVRYFLQRVRVLSLTRAARKGSRSGAAYA